MADIVIPDIIQGPAWVVFGGMAIYVQKDIQVKENVDSWNPGSTFGPLGERHKSRRDVLTFTPVGMVTADLLDLFYDAFLNPAGAIGRSILDGEVKIASLAENKTYGWNRGGISKPPGLFLGPTGTAFKSMSLDCLQKAATQPTANDFWKLAETTVDADTSFDHTAIVSDIYTAALGERGAPYNAMGSMAGFDIDFGFLTAPIPAADVGIADIIRSGFSLGVSFPPSKMTEAQVNTLLGQQGADVVLPGQAYAKAGEDLVLVGTQVGWNFTLKRVGAKMAERVYVIGEHRWKGLSLVNELGFTDGVMDALFEYAGPVAP